MGRPRKKAAAEWKTLVTLTRKYGDGGKPVPGPAIQVTYANGRDRFMFSHTPGIVSDDGSFRSVQHLHDRHVEEYLLLLMDAAIAVKSTASVSMEVIDSTPEAAELFRTAIRDNQKADETLSVVETAHREARMFKRVMGGRGPSRKPAAPKPTLTASLGDMLKAKEGR